jgi:tocopherol O-methyltransferase
MIHPRHEIGAGDVAGHYDELDPVYRALWGEHVHHGLWRTGRESQPEAVAALSDFVGDRLALAPGVRLADIGCGYGATARRFAARGASVTGFTLSAAQVAAAPEADGVTLHCRDWLHNGLPDASFDAAYAIESTEHFGDKPRLFSETARVLRAAGRFVVCAWLAADAPRGWEVRHLLEPICREGRLPSLGTADEYRQMAAAAGLACMGFDDVSAQVARTWDLCLARMIRSLVTQRRMRQAALKARNRDFALSVPRLAIAYRTGALRYGVFAFSKSRARCAKVDTGFARTTRSTFGI